MQQARRMFVVAKVTSKILLEGAINAIGHVTSSLGLHVNDDACNVYDDMITMSNHHLHHHQQYSSAVDHGARLDHVGVASVDAFVKLVEAGKSVCGMTSVVGTDLV